jgi:large subunit ribosomal protein L15
MKLNELIPPEGSRKARKRVGRGVGSGHGKTAGRGSKGHNSRSGGGVRPGFEGGQMPLQRRLPKRGFTNIFKKKIAVLNLRDLARFESGSIVDEAALVRIGLVKGRRDGIKILGKGEITVPLTVKVNGASKSAREKILAAGGNIEVY